MRRSVALSVAAFAAVAVTAILALRAADRLELPLRDAALRLIAPLPATSTVVVAIDEQSIREFGRWPQPLGPRMQRNSPSMTSNDSLS